MFVWTGHRRRGRLEQETCEGRTDEERKQEQEPRNEDQKRHLGILMVSQSHPTAHSQTVCTHGPIPKRLSWALLHMADRKQAKLITMLLSTVLMHSPSSSSANQRPTSSVTAPITLSSLIPLLQQRLCQPC